MKKNSPYEYFLASGKGSLIGITFSLLATILGASSTIGLVGLAYRIGLPASLWLTLGCIGLFILYFIYPRFEFGAANYTVIEYLGNSYPGTRKTLALIVFISWVGVISAQFLALARLFKFYFPESDLLLLLTVSAGMVILYTSWGGQRAVLITDNIQFLLFFIGILILSGRVFGDGIKTGILPALDVYLRFPCNKYFSFWDFVYFSLILIPVYIIGPDIHSRLFCSSSIKIRRKALVITASGLVMVGFILTILGIFAHVLDLQFQPDEVLYQLSLKFLTVKVVLYLFLISLISMLFSSADTCLLTSATIFVRDFLNLRTEQVFYTRIIIVVVGFMSVLLAFCFNHIINLLLFSYSVYSAGVLIPFLIIPFKEKLGISDKNVKKSLLVVGPFAFITGLLNFKPGIFLAYLLSAIIIFYSRFNPRKILLLLGGILFFSSSIRAQTEIELGKITVSESAEFRPPHQRSIYAPQISLGSSDLSEIIDAWGIMDIKARGKYGIQNDVYIRGMGFEHNLVTIDGIPVNDPQTGHFNLDIPLTVYDWKEVNVVPGCDVIKGNCAIGGILNITTSEIINKEFRFRTIWGEKQLNITTLSFARPGEDISFKLSIDRKSSGSYRPETDFKTGTIFSKIKINSFPSTPVMLLGWMDKDFGADSFYSSSYPHEKEHTRTWFSMITFDLSGPRGKIKPQVFYRRHEDEFVLIRWHPEFYRNTHTTQSYLFRLPWFLNYDCWALNSGIELAREDIKSTNLGKHLRTRFSGYLSLKWPVSKKLTDAILLRIDNYNRYDPKISWNFLTEYNLSPVMDIYLSAHQSFRVPSFTELHYSSPANRGNSDLKPERGLGFEIGAKNKGRKYSWGFSLFQLFGYHIIDWVKDNLNDPWRAKNTSYVRNRGIETWLECKNLKLSYSYLDGSYKTEYEFSKYVSNYLRHNLNVEYKTKLLGFEIFADLNYRKPENLDDFLNLNVVVSKVLNPHGRVFFKVDNLFNSKQEEVPGVILSGRWFSLGMEFRF
jgi:iron complex outermembrane receptor protein